MPLDFLQIMDRHNYNCACIHVYYKKITIKAYRIIILSHIIIHILTLTVNKCSGVDANDLTNFTGNERTDRQTYKQKDIVPAFARGTGLMI